MDKFLIGIGDSFTQGQGSITPDLYEKYGDAVYESNHRLPIDAEERANSWVGQAAKKLPDYYPINLGQRGKGNRSAAKELYLNSLDPSSEKIVVYCLSGMERFDLVQKDFSSQHFYAMFPNPNFKEHKNELYRIYAREIYSDQMAVVETMLNIAEVQNWCKANNAKLLLVSAFDSQINREYFNKTLPYNKKHLVDIVDWSLFWRPRGYDTFLHMLIDLQENKSDEVEKLKDGNFWNKYYKNFPCKEYITPCCHPTYKSHGLFASSLRQELRKREYVQMD